MWVHGILRYRDFATLGALQRAVDRIRRGLPDEWRISIIGPAGELLAHGARLRRNWLSALAASATLIFATVLAVFRNLRQALLSLVPAAAVLIGVTGLAPSFGVRIDDYTVIALAITAFMVIGWLRTRHLPLEFGTAAAETGPDPARRSAPPLRRQPVPAFTAQVAPVVLMEGQKPRKGTDLTGLATGGD